MIKREAKELSLEIWRFFAENPLIQSKRGLPESLFKKIEHMKNMCPLCGLLRNRESKPECKYECRAMCPLGSCGAGSAYHRWYYAAEFYKREEAAQDIAEVLEAWRPG